MNFWMILLLVFGGATVLWLLSQLVFALALVSMARSIFTEGDSNGKDH